MGGLDYLDIENHSVVIPFDNYMKRENDQYAYVNIVWILLVLSLVFTTLLFAVRTRVAMVCEPTLPPPSL